MPLPDPHRPPPAVITSRQNPIVKHFQSVRLGRSPGLIFLEGPRLVGEAFRTGAPIESFAASQSLVLEGECLEAMRSAERAFRVSAPVLRAIADVEEPRGLAAIVGRPNWDWSAILSRHPLPIVILDGIQDPGNAGTIVRTAEAAGAAGLLTTPGTAGLFGPKAIRGSAGSVLRVPSLEHRPVPEILERLDAGRYGLLAAASAGGPGARQYTDV
ncbi:MAG TPA: TrmH family RNA methyltransferase, partial [Elusimicrobiota bacterium]|nr:TrmH family RNA methyltransferase [Elusimicrobiota bacterium]